MVSGIADYPKKDLTQVMDPTTSKARGYDLTFEGMYNIWTGTSNPYNSSSPNASIQSESTLSELPPVQPASTRGTITQGSAAWTLLRAYQSPQSPIPSTCIDKTGSLAETVDPSYAAVIQAINSRRTDLSHPGAPGRQRLPLSEREGARRMILAICGEKDDRAGEIDR